MDSYYNEKAKKEAEERIEEAEQKLKAALQEENEAKRNDAIEAARQDAIAKAIDAFIENSKNDENCIIS